MLTSNKQVIAKIAMSMQLQVATPGLTLDEAKDRFLAAHPKNRILDFGDEAQKVILGAEEKGRYVAYEFVRECSPPGATIQDCMTHMRARGMDVRGISPNGHHIMVWERE